MILVSYKICHAGHPDGEVKQTIGNVDDHQYLSYPTYAHTHKHMHTHTYLTENSQPKEEIL